MCNCENNKKRLKRIFIISLFTNKFPVKLLQIDRVETTEDGVLTVFRINGDVDGDDVDSNVDDIFTTLAKANIFRLSKWMNISASLSANYNFA